ncbi:MAG: hypothetical protein IJ213_07450 [Bacteroidales bacterium]|nr:hypothetical protein [Bacteroidales bacterium]
MKRIFYPIICFCIVILFGSCTVPTVLQIPQIIKNEPVDNYKYVYVTPTKELTSSYGEIINSLGYTVSKSVNPQDVISGILINKGYIILPELDSAIAEETLVVTYGESGRRYVSSGYTIEVTIQFISAKTHKLVCSCTAEGQGSTEADDIREAITRALRDF